MELRKDTDKSRALRTRSTDAELALWKRLRDRRLEGFKFRRQYAISGFVVDFACLENKLVVELDGGQHAEQSGDDEHRSTILAKSGFRVVRFWNDDVLLRIDAVLEEILRQLSALPQSDTPPSPQPSPASGRGG